MGRDAPQRAAAHHPRRGTRVVARSARRDLPRHPRLPARRVAEGGGEAVNRTDRFVRIGGALIWIFAAFPVTMETHTPPARWAVWVVSYLTFGVALFFATRPRGSHIVPMAVEVAAVVGMVLSLYDGYGGTLLVIVAMQLAGVMSRRNA